MRPVPADAADRVQAGFQLTPVAVHVLRVDVAPDVLAGAVVNPVVDVAVCGQATVALAPAGVDCAPPADRPPDYGHERPVLGVGRQPDAHLGGGVREVGVLPLDEAEYGLLARPASALRAPPADVDGPVPPRAADVGLVRLAGAAQQPGHVGRHGLPNGVRHLVRRPVRHRAVLADAVRGPGPDEGLDGGESLLLVREEARNRVPAGRRPLAETLPALAVAAAEAP